MEQISPNTKRWKIGDRIEAKDFMNVWYQSKVVACDEKEDAILVHFEGWSQRFDEWFPSNSEKLRPLSSEFKAHRDVSKISSTQFLKAGQYVFAPWKDGKLYPGKIRSINHKQKKYEVSFLDGLKTKISFRKVHVMTDEEIKEMDPDVGTKSETLSFTTITNSASEDDARDSNVSSVQTEISTISRENPSVPPAKKPRLETTENTFKTSTSGSSGSSESHVGPLIKTGSEQKNGIEDRVDDVGGCDDDDDDDDRSVFLSENLTVSRPPCKRPSFDGCEHQFCRNCWRPRGQSNAAGKCLLSPNYEQFSASKYVTIINALCSITKSLKYSEKRVKVVRKLDDGGCSNEKVYLDCESIKEDQRNIEELLNRIEGLVDNRL